MNICIIGGTGHIGGHLVPMCVQHGMNVKVITRGRASLPAGAEWKSVRFAEASYSAGDSNWRTTLREISADADVLIDLLGIDLATTYDAVSNVCHHVIACGSFWMLGLPRRVPTPPVAQNEFWGEAYAARWKVIQEVLQRSTSGGANFTVILPPNICGPGKIPLDTRGGRSIEVHHALAAGQPVTLPHGADVLIGPCDAEDVAQAFYLAAIKPESSSEKILNVGSENALTATEFVATYADIYGVTIPINRVDWSEFAKDVVTDPGARYHFEAHMCPDISDIRNLLGYQPKHTPEQSMRRAVDWMRLNRLLSR